ncbi:glycylpeptide N-tetradecanoyltransferase 2 [Strongylocentrotus purpuratus]|uniref:Glycylpeptide N-tetradecanoyltransferase n=1 Tax=Strongylocentrotus purpuratus TaxID=7668 RepID=A0A7M7N4M4_STRPU|nr:glycylpeptide N-tetradecanoyltransferase 2 [Strongylocentrotus purpuratus]
MAENMDPPKNEGTCDETATNGEKNATEGSSTAQTKIGPADDLEEQPSTSQQGAIGGADDGGKDKKKKKKKKKKGDGASGGASGGVDQIDARLSQNPQISMSKLKAAMELFVPQGPAKNMDEAKKKTYNFWETQPVPSLEETVSVEVNKAVEADKTDIRKEPYSLPQGFSWDTLDIHSEVELRELYNLLNENYVEDDDNMFRFDYSAEFLQWALTPPGWLREWHCTVRVDANKKLVGFISAVPARIKVNGKIVRMVEINFLCVHKKLRSKRVAPVLIREITRRVHLQGIFQAVYTAGVVLPKPVSTCRYWHRSLNPKKLVEVKFSHIGRNMTLQRTIKLYKLPEETKTPGLRPIQPQDMEKCHKLLSDYLDKFKLAPVFDLEEFKHWFTPRPNIVSAYVAEVDGVLTDMISFYTLPSSIMHHPVHKQLKAAYAFYNVTTRSTWETLMLDALTLAKQEDFDVFNALDLMDNKEFLEKLKFGIGDGNLQYYIYNWICPTMKPQEIGLVLQ